jgi:hypothetical protein
MAPPAPRSAPGTPRHARRARLVAALAVVSFALALTLAPVGAAAAPTPAPTPATDGPADRLAQAHQADLVLAAIAAAAEGRDLPAGLSPQVAEDLQRLVVDTTLGNDARLTAFAPLVPLHWERASPLGSGPPPPGADTVLLRARLLGTATVAHAATPGRPARTVRRPLARQEVTIALARRDGRWLVTRITLTAAQSLAE